MAAAIRLSQQHSCSFDHLVGEREQIVGDVDAERLGSLEIDHELEFGYLHDGQVTWLLAFENATNIEANLTVHVGDAGAVAHQAPRQCIFAKLILPALDVAPLMQSVGPVLYRK